MNVVASEMSAIWGTFDKKPAAAGDEGMNALMAQAVAARSYSLNYIKQNAVPGGEHPNGLICNTSKCQRYEEGLVIDPNDPTASRYPAVLAVQNTAHMVLIDARGGYGGIAPGYYAASTNSLNGDISSGSEYCYQATPSQGDGWTGDPDFSEDNYFDAASRPVPVSGYPCFRDDVLDEFGNADDFEPNKGHPRAGHGAGMSQTGALHWAIGTHWNPRYKNGVSGEEYPYYNSSLPTTGYADSSDIGAEIKDANNVNLHTKDWRQILMHYYVYPFVTHKSNPGIEERWYQLTAAKRVSADQSIDSEVILPTDDWTGTEMKILDGMTAIVRDLSGGSGKLILDNDEADRPSYLIVAEGADVTFEAEMEIRGDGAELTCKADGTITASIRLEQDALISADGGCLQASGSNAIVTIAAGKTVTFENGGFLSNQGGTFVLEDNAIIVIAATADEPEIDPGSVFLMGLNAKIIIERPVTVSGTLNDPIRFERLDPAKQWDHLDLKADGNLFTYVVFDGGEKTVEVRSKGTTFNRVRFKNGWRGISSGYAVTGGSSSFKLFNSIVENSTSVGVVAYHSNPTVKGSTIHNNAQAGVWLYDAISNDFYDNLIENNATVSTTRSGLEVEWNSSVTTKDGGFSRIADNPYHEIKVGSGASSLLLGIMGVSPDGYNTITDADGNTGGEKYVYNSSSITAWVEEVFWDGSTSSSDFYGSVNYGYPLGGDYAQGAGAPESIVPSKMDRGRFDTPVIAGRANSPTPTFAPNLQNADEKLEAYMRQLREEIEKAPYDAGNEQRLRDLFALQVFDRADSLREKAANLSTISFIRTLSDAAELDTGLDELQRSAIAKSGATAVLLEIKNAFYDDRYEDARVLAAQYDGKIEDPAFRMEFLQAQVALLEQEGRYREALEVLAEAKVLAGEETSGLDMVEAMLLEQMESSPLKGGQAFVDRTEILRENSDESLQVFTLGAGYPNPFNPVTTIPFTLSGEGDVQVEVYDVRGRRIAVLADGFYAAGSYSVTFEASDLPSGVYLVRARMQSTSGEAFTQIQRLTLTK